MVGQQVLDLFIGVRHVIRRGALSNDRANPLTLNYVLFIYPFIK